MGEAPVPVVQHPPKKLFIASVSLVVSIALFSGIYAAISAHSSAPPFEGFGSPRRFSFGETVYFAVVTQSTVGYGNIGPRSMAAKAACAAQAAMTLAVALFLAS